MIKGLNIIDNVKISSDIEALHASLKRLFFTPIGSQIGNLDYGSRIPEYLFEQATEENILAILNEAKDLILNYEPRIILNAIGAEVQPTMNTGALQLVINIEFYWVGDENTDNLNTLQITA